MSKVFKGALIFTAFFFIQKVASFLLLPLYTAYLSPNDYGQLGVANSLSAALSILFLLALNGPIVRFFHDEHSDPEYIRKLWGNCLIILFAWSGGLLLVLVATRDVFLKRVVGVELLWPVGWIAVLTAFFSPPFVLYQAYLQTQQKAKEFAVNNAVFFLMMTLGSILLVVPLRMGAMGVLLSMLAVNFVFFLYSLVKIIPQAIIKIDIKISKSILAYALPLVPHALSGWITGMMDRLFISSQLSTYSVGIYNVSYQISFALVSIAMAINQAFIPWFHSRMRDASQAAFAKIRAVTETCIAGYLIMAVTVSIWIEEILSLVVNSSFSDAAKYVPILMSSAVWGGIYFFLSAPIFYNKVATRKLPAITLGCSLINVIGNIFLIRQFDIYGAAITSLAGSLAAGMAVALYSKRISPISYRMSLVFISAILCGAIPYIKFAPFAHTIGSKVAITLASISLVAFFYRESSREIVMPLMRKAVFKCALVFHFPRP